MFTNRNLDAPAAVEKVTAFIGLIRDAHGVPITNPAVCSAADFGITPAQPAIPFQVTARSGGVDGLWGGPTSTDNVKVKFRNLPDRNQNGCKGVTLNLTYEVSNS